MYDYNGITIETMIDGSIYEFRVPANMCFGNWQNLKTTKENVINIFGQPSDEEIVQGYDTDTNSVVDFYDMIYYLDGDIKVAVEFKPNDTFAHYVYISAMDWEELYITQHAWGGV